MHSQHDISRIVISHHISLSSKLSVHSQWWSDCTPNTWHIIVAASLLLGWHLLRQLCLQCPTFMSAPIRQTEGISKTLYCMIRHCRKDDECLPGTVWTCHKSRAVFCKKTCPRCQKCMHIIWHLRHTGCHESGKVKGHWLRGNELEQGDNQLFGQSAHLVHTVAESPAPVMHRPLYETLCAKANGQFCLELHACASTFRTPDFQTTFPQKQLPGGNPLGSWHLLGPEIAHDD